MPERNREVFVYRPAPLVFAHRGGMGEQVASSLTAFVAAARLGNVGLELDIHPTVDGQLVVFHDDDLAPSTNSSGPVSSFRLDELKEIVDLDGTRNSAEGRVPMVTLEEVFSSCPESSYSIDIKEDLGDDSWVEGFLANLIDTHVLNEKTVVASFLDPPLSRFRQVAGKVRTAASRSESLAWYNDYMGGVDREYPFSVLSLPLRFMGAEYLAQGVVDRAHDQGLEIWVWTVNDEGDLRRVADMGFDVVITDYPSLALEILGG